MQKLRNTIILGLLLAVIVSLTSCETTLNVRVRRPAEIDIRGAKTISVLPFQTSSWGLPGMHTVVRIMDFFVMSSSSHGGSEPYERCASYMTSQINQSLLQEDYYTLIDPYVIQQQINRGETPSADIYLSGRINYVDSFVDVEHRKKVKDDKTYYYDEYQRRVRVGVSYMIIDSKTNAVIDMKTADLEASSGYYENTYRLPDDFELIRPELNSLVRKISRQVQPYYVTKSISLLEDSSKNPDMKLADQLAKEGLYEKSYEKFWEIYTSTGLFEAGYNASMVCVAMGDYEKARDIMTELVDTTGVKKAMKALTDINREIMLANRVAEQTQ